MLNTIHAASKLLPLMFSTCAIAAIAAEKAPVKLVEDPCLPPIGFRVGVFDDGRLELNGSTISTAAFSKSIETLKPETMICIYRERPESDEPPPNFMRIVETLISTSAIRKTVFYWDPAFVQRIVFER